MPGKFEGGRPDGFRFELQLFGEEVTIPVGESATVDGVTYTNTSTAKSENTITVGVDANGCGAVSRIDNNATCAVSVPQGKSIVFGANKFTAVGGPATFTADSSYAPTLTSDSLVTIDTPCGLKAKGVEVTNSSSPNAPIPVTVDATDVTSDYATITTADGGACSVTFTEVGAQVMIDGTLYTNAQPAPLPKTGKTTLVKTGGTMKLTGGAVTIGAATLQTGNNNAAITNKNDKKITVDSGSVITDVEDGTEFDVEISNTAVAIEGKTYQTTGNGSAKFTVTKSDGALNVALTSGELVLDPDASCAVNLPEDMSFQIGDATYTNESGKAATFTVADGKISVDGGSSVAVAGVEVDASVTIANTSEPGSKIYLDAKNPGSIKSAAADAEFTVRMAETVAVTVLGKVYTAAAGNVTLAYNGTANPPMLTQGKVSIGKGASVTVNSTTITNQADAALAVDSNGEIFGAKEGGTRFTVGGTTYEVGAVNDGCADISAVGDRIGVYNNVEFFYGIKMTLSDGEIKFNVGDHAQVPVPSSVALAYVSGKNFYALVKTDGRLTAVGYAKEADAKKDKNAIGYFKFTAEGSKQTVTFHDMSGKQAKAIGAVNIDVKGLQGEKGQPLSGLDVTGLSESAVNLTNVPTTVADVVGDSDTSYAPSFTLADEQTITLGSEAGTVYYALTAGNPGERNVASCTIEKITDANATTAAKLAKVNYFKVVTASNGVVTVSYQKATNGTAITLEKSAELHVDASGAAAGAKITVNDGVTNLVDAGANGGVTAAVGSDKNTTIGSLTYKTGFAWAPGTYILDAGTAELAVAAPENPVNTYNDAYQKVAVTKNGDVYKAVITGCDANGKTCLPAIETINLPDAVTKFDATGAGVVGKTIECANADATVTLGAKDTTTVRSAENGKLHIVQGNTTSTFTATNGVIAVQGGKAFAGHFSLKEDSPAAGITLTGSKTTPAGGDVTAVTIKGTAGEPGALADATVGFANGAITYIIDLSTDETFKVTVREGGKDVVYTYTVDSGAKAIKKTGPSGTFYTVLMDDNRSEDCDILAADNVWAAPDMADAAFAWKQGTYYFSVTDGVGAVKKLDGKKAAEVQTGKAYIKAKIDGNGKLTLASVTGVAGHQATGADNGEGKTVAVDAAGTKLIYKKEGEFAVDFTNVAADSDFSGLGANDALTTAKLAKGGKVTVDGNVYEAAANNAVLSFAGSGLASGTVTVGNGVLNLADGSTVWMGADDTSAVLTAANGAITSVTGLDKGEMLVVTKDDVETTYTAYTDTIIWKTEGGATTVAQLAKKGNDVMAAVYKKPVATTTNFNLYNENQWPCNFLVEDNNVEIENGEVTIDFRNAGSTFVRTTIADDRTLTLKQGVVGWDGSLPEDGKLTALSGAYDITIDALATTVNFTRPAATKTANYTGKISIIGVGENSNLTVGANDSVRTVCLGKGDFVTVNGVKYEKAIAGDGEFSFLGDGLKEGTVRVTEKAALADGSTVAVAGGDGVVMTAATDEYGTRITSLKGIGEGETVTITSADKKTVTTYAYKSAGYVTKTVKINNTVASTTDLKLPENADGNIFAEGIVETTTLRKAFAWTDATTAGVKFYRTFTKNSNGNIEAMIGELTGNGNEVIEVKKGDVVVEATAKKSGTTDVLTLAVKQYDGAALVNVEDRLGYTIIVSGTNTTALHCDAGSVQEKIQARNVQGGSVFTNLAAGSYVSTVAVAAGSTVSVNGQTFTAAKNTTLYLYATETATGAKSASIQKGTVVVTGTITSTDGSSLISSLTYKGPRNGDGVVVRYESGVIKSLTDLEAGETVTVVEANGVTKQYTTDGTTYTRVTTTPSKGTRVTETITPSEGNIYVDGSPVAVKTEVTPAFAWPDGVTSTSAVCYAALDKNNAAVIDPNARQSWAAVDGNTFVKATVAKENANAPATVTLERVTGTGAAALSDAGVFAAGENVSVKGLKKGDTVVVGGKSFFAGADTDMALAFREGGTPAVTEGALELVTDLEAFSTTGTVKNGNTVSEIVSVATYKRNEISENVVGVVVTVKNGEVTGISGLDWALSRLDNDVMVGERVDITRTVDGVPTTMTYQVTGVSSEKGKEGWTVITRTEQGTDNTWQCVVADSAENILEGGEDRWTVTNLHTRQDFNWNGVGYFLTTDAVAKQNGNTSISAADEWKGKTLLKVTAKTANGITTITNVGFVKVQANGVLVETTAPENFQGVTIDAAGLAGVALPAHTVKVAIINVDDVKGFAGLNAADTVSGGELPCMVSLGTADKNGKFTATSTFFVHEGPYTINGAGELVEGTFAVTGKATAAAKGTVEYKFDKPDCGVLVTVKDGSVAGVKYLDVGGTVTVTGSVKGDKDVYTAALDKDDNTKTVITRTTTRSGMTVKYTKTVGADNLHGTDVIAMNGYTASPFDFGTTSDGSVGIFEVGHNENDNEQATIAAQTAGVTFDDTANGKKYLAVAATKDKTGMVTINRMNVVSFTAGEFRNADFAPGTIFIEAPEGAGLTLSKDADASRRPAPGSPDVIMAFQIKNAQAGKSYLGFSGEDAVFATLEKDQTITVGASAKTAKTVKAKADGEVTVLGDGKVYGGTFEIGAGLTAGLSDYFSSKISGPAAAVAVIEKGMVVGLSGLKAGQKVTVSTNYLGAVSTEEYAAAKTANADGTLTITRTKTADGVTTVATADVETGGEIAADTVAYTATGESVNSTFDWTKPNSGYFLTSLTEGDMKNFGDVEVRPSTTKITKDNAGEIYLKAKASGDYCLQRVMADGMMEDVAWGDDMTGTLTITGMLGDFNRDKNHLPADVRVAVVDAATYYDQRSGEVATAHLYCLQAGDVVTTTKLAAGEKIRVNDVYYTMGAADLLRVEIGADGKPVLVDGTVQISDYQTIETTKGSFTIGVGYTVVKVLDGEVVAVFGGVFVTDGQGNIATYTAAGVSYTTTVNGAIRTAALTKGQTVSIGGKTYTAGSDGAVTFNKTNSGVTLVDGVLLLEADTTDDTSLALKDATVTFHEALWNNSHVLVAVRNGVVASITGLKKGDWIKVGDTTYTAVSDTMVTKTDSNGTTNLYLSAAGGDVLRAADNTTDVSQPGNAIEGQFYCDGTNSRSTGYFDVTVKKDSKGNVVSKTATIAEQTAKTYVKAAKGTEQIYAVASLANGVLSIGAIQAANDGTKTVIKSADKATLLDENTRLSVTAPPRVIKYCKEDGDKFRIALNNVAGDSTISGLDAGDTVKTEVLDAGRWVRIGDDSIPTNTITYMAGAKGALTFQGEGTNKTTLLNGVIKLNAASITSIYVNTTAILSGTADSNPANNITVIADGKDAMGQPINDDITVVVKNGVVTSITGFKTLGAKVTLTVAGDTAVVYEVMRSLQDAKTGLWTVMVKRTEGGHVSYGTFTEKQNYYATSSTNAKGVYSVTNGYKAQGADTVTNTENLWTANGTKTAYVVSGDTLAQTANGTIDASADDPYTGNRGDIYVVATVTTANGVSTIKSLQKVIINAQGVPEIVKGATASGVKIDGTIDAGAHEYAKLNFAIPKATAVTITNAALGSVFTGVKALDSISSAAADGYALSKGSVTVYHGKESRTVTYTPGTKDATAATISTIPENSESYDGKITGLKGLDTAGEKVTIVEQTSGGRITTTYAVANVTVGSGKTAVTKKQLTKTVEDANGQKKVFSVILDDLSYEQKTEAGFTDAASYDWLKDTTLLTEDTASRAAVSEFDWTTAKKLTGYFEVATAKNGTTSATVAAQTKAVAISPYADAKQTKANEKSYIAVSISADGVVSGVRQVRFDRSNTLASYGAGEGETKFSGTVNIAAPTAALLYFDRNAVDADTVDSTATVNITGVMGSIYSGVPGVNDQEDFSVMENLKEGDTVTTAKLAVANAKTGAPAQKVQIRVAGDAEISTFTAGAAGALSFRVQEGNVLALTGGTIELPSSSGPGEYLRDYIHIGTRLLKLTHGNLTVTATNGGKAYTVGDLKEGETFTVEDFATGTVREYKRSATTLFCTTKGDTTTTSVYNIGAGVSITSAVLEGRSGWTVYTDANKTFKEDNTLVSGKAVTVDLTKAETRVAADGKAWIAAGNIAGDFLNTPYDLVIDKYMVDPKKATGLASVIGHDNLIEDVEAVIGTVSAGWYHESSKEYRESSYVAASGVAQTIKVADSWKVLGSGKDDVIYGAAKGYDILRGEAGDDTLIGGGADDTFRFGLHDTGHDVVKSYVTGKDEITFEYNSAYNGFDIEDVELVPTQVGKSFTADVLLHDGTYDEETGDYTNGVLLSGMGNGQAVTINNKTYYFGSAVSTKGMTFAYKEGAYYVANGNTTTANTLTVGTDNTKATAKALGDKVEVDLSDTAHYRNIDTADASKSGNDLILTADGDGSTLKGGTYKSTLKAGAGQDSLVGGSGEDVFWFDTVEKNDTVTGYTSGKDSLYLGDFDKEKNTAVNVNGLEVTVSGSDVVFSNGDLGSVTLKNGVNAAKPVTIRADAEGKETMDYYVGKAGTYDKNGKLTAKATNAFTATVGKDAGYVDPDAATKEIALTSYYVGNDSANDTLKLVGTDKTNKLTAKVSLQEMAKHASSIDTLDVSGLTAVAGSEVTVEGKREGTFTLIGSANNKVKESFDLSKLTAGDNKVAVTNFSVDDVIELAAGMTLEKANGANAVYTMRMDGKDYGTLTITGAKAANINYNESANRVEYKK